MSVLLDVVLLVLLGWVAAKVLLLSIAGACLLVAKLRIDEAFADVWKALTRWV